MNTRALITSTWQLLALAVLAVFLVLYFFVAGNAPHAAGSVGIGNDYQGTTTSQGRFTNDITLATGTGSFGSIVITGAAAGVINIYDATTSNVSARTGQTASSTILLASIPASAAAGTYTFDRVYENGLYVDIVGTIPTTTITYR
jgi:hypothetical protein